MPKPTKSSEFDKTTSTAFHEAAHATIGRLLGGKVGAVTIAPGATFSGCTIVHFPQSAREPADREAGVLPIHAPARRELEADILWASAGPLAEDLLRSGHSGRRPPTLAERLDRYADTHIRNIPVSATEMAEIATVDAEWLGQPEFDRSDEGLIWAAALDLNSGDAAAARHHIAWLTIWAARLLAERWASVERVAAALLERTTLPGIAVELLLVERPPG